MRKKPFAASLASRKLLESQGWTVDVVEQRIPHTFITRDCFGFADLLAISPSMGIMLVQVTGGPDNSNFCARVQKIKATAESGLWLASGGRIQVHSWESSKPQSEHVYKGRWCRVLEVTVENNV